MSRRGAVLAWPALSTYLLKSATKPCNAAVAVALSGVLPCDLPSRPHPHANAASQLPVRHQLHRKISSLSVRTLSPTCTRGFSASALTHMAAGADSNGPPSSSGDSSSVSGKSETRLNLGEALNQLVDAAVEKVEAGALDEAVSLLREGLSTFEPVFPNSPELGELHNQAALLLLFQNKAEEAVHHAQISLDTTRRHFGGRSVLTAHRRLRLGVARFVQGQLADAAGLLREAHELLGGGGAPSSPSAAAATDPGSRSEAGFYLDCVALAHVRDAGGVEALGSSLRENMRGLKDAYGPDSMILSLALAQHNRLVNGGLEGGGGVGVGEALLRQHISLLKEVAGPEAEDVGVATYKLATFYYANDMCKDAGAAVKQAAVLLRAHYAEDHDMVVLCKHRLGMICAAQGEHRAATQLLEASHKHFGAEGGQSMLAQEAKIGLAMAKFGALEGTRESTSRWIQLRQDTLELIRSEIRQLAASIGDQHMLVRGATRYYGHLAALAR